MGHFGVPEGVWDPLWDPLWGPPRGVQNDPILDPPISGVLIFMWELDMKWVPGPQKGSQMGVPLLTPFGSFPQNHG